MTNAEARFNKSLRPQKPEGSLGRTAQDVHLDSHTAPELRIWRLGEREIIYLFLHCHHQNDSCIKMGSDESHFNISVGSDGQSHRTVSTNHNLSEEKGEPKRYRTEVLPLTSLPPYRWAKPALIPSVLSYHTCMAGGNLLLAQDTLTSSLS